MGFRLSAAILAGKAAARLSRARGYRGTSLPGLVARKICPAALKDLSAQVRRDIIVVSGTNGKTTTTNMIAGVLEDAGYKVIVNREGSNMISGVTASFVANSAVSAHVDCDYAVLEVDEASMPAVLEETTPKVVLLTNFFRDQLDRYWELDKIIGVINDSIQKLKQSTTLVLNADDPLVAQLRGKTGLPAMFYGLSGHKLARKTNTQTREAKFCPCCGFALVYEFFNYGQLGTYYCPNCVFQRPELQVEALGTVSKSNVNCCRIRYKKGEASLVIQALGLYNLYNALAAFTVGLHLGINVRTILSSLKKYQPVFGRMERFTYKRKPVYLNLVKNPTGFNEALAALCDAEGKKDVFIAVNDNYADSRDISWLWDVDFELLGREHQAFETFICSGRRAEEMALRLKYANVPVERIAVNNNMRLAIEQVLSGPAQACYLFPTYTALWPAHKILEFLAVKGNADDQRMPSVS
ncbi:MAG: Mur ligase family protein [Peptococcaceae bacterium]|nr:Mur ligase family protein [Peptococcaceae bacterium]